MLNMRDISITSSVSPSHCLFSLDSIITLCVGCKQVHDFAVNIYLYSLALPIFHTVLVCNECWIPVQLVLSLICTAIWLLASVLGIIPVYLSKESSSVLPSLSGLLGYYCFFKCPVYNILYSWYSVHYINIACLWG